MNEVWKTITDFSDYQVSNLGKVQRVGVYSNQLSVWNKNLPKELTPRKHSNGYLRVMFSVNNKHYDRYIHRLVALMFLENPQNYPEVNHIDGNKENNKVDNLEWCTRSQNNKHMYDMLNAKRIKGFCGRKKKCVMIDMNTNIILQIFNSTEEAALNCGLKCIASVSACCSYAKNPNKYKRPIYSCGGYKWRYATEDMKVGDKLND